MSGLQFFPITRRAQIAKDSPRIVSTSPRHAATEVAGITCQDNGPPRNMKPPANKSHHPSQTTQTDMRDAPSDRDWAVCFRLLPVIAHNPNLAAQGMKIVLSIHSRMSE